MNKQTLLAAVMDCTLTSIGAHPVAPVTDTDHARKIQADQDDPCHGLKKSLCSCERDHEGAITGCSGGGD